MSALAAPNRTIDQRLQALALANQIRSARAELKTQLRRRREDPVRVLLDPPPDTANMKVFELLLAVPKVGRVKANQILTKTRISPSKTIGGMSERQRHELAALLAPFQVTRR